MSKEQEELRELRKLRDALVHDANNALPWEDREPHWAEAIRLRDKYALPTNLIHYREE